MFKGLIRKLSGIKGYKELLTKSVAIVKTYADTDDSVLGFLARNEEYLIGWIDYIAPHLVEISNVDSVHP